jgi:uncharacterized protein YhjY with autotransporter beta-barrel domain
VSAGTSAALRRAVGPAAGWRLDDTSAFTVSLAGDGFSRATQPFAIGFTDNSTAFGIGYRRHVGDAWTLGAAVEVSSGEVTLDGRVDGKDLGAFTRNGVRVALTAQGRLGPVEIEAATIGGGDRLSDIQRTTGVAGQIARGDTRATSVGSSLYLSYPVRLGAFTDVMPFVGVQNTSARVEGYREREALGLNQDVKESTRDTTQLELGVSASTKLDNVLLEGSVAWVADVGENDPAVRSALVTVPGVVRTLPGAEQDSDHASFSLGSTFPLGQHTAVSLRGSGEVGGDRDAWSAMLTLTYRP